LPISSKNIFVCSLFHRLIDKKENKRCLTLRKQLTGMHGVHGAYSRAQGADHPGRAGLALDRLLYLVSGYLEQAKADAQWHRSQLGQLKSELTETEGALKRLVGIVEAGLMEVDDPALAERLKPSKPNVAACKGRSAQPRPPNRRIGNA
jgi:hypothetical protein